jgi:hypothetical protein
MNLNYLTRAFPVVIAMAMLGEPKAEVAVYNTEFDAFKNKTLEQKVQELADREEIRELIARYAQRVAQRQPFFDLFTEDGVYRNHYENNPVSELRGRKAIGDFMDKRPADAALGGAIPQIHNIVLEISGDEARGICSNELRISENGKSIIASGYYIDKFRRENGRWRFASREITWFHWADLKESWAKPTQTKAK